MVGILERERHNSFLDGLLDGPISRLMYLATGNGERAHEREFGSPSCPYGKGAVHLLSPTFWVATLGEAISLLPYLLLDGTSIFIRGNPGDGR